MEFKIIASRKKILIIEDNRNLCWLLKNILAPLQCGIDVVNDGESAFCFLKASTPDIVLLDMRLPDVNGLSILKEIRTREKPIAVIVITAFSSEYIRDEAEDLGISAFFSKPFNSESLQKTVKDILEGCVDNNAADG